jgi:hypothetical protein
MDLTNPPSKYWHCLVRPKGKKSTPVVNDLMFEDIQKTIIIPWHEKRVITVSGTLVDPAAGVEQIRIVQTQGPKQAYGCGLMSPRPDVATLICLRTNGFAANSRKVSGSDPEAIFSSYLKKEMWHFRHAVLALNRLECTRLFGGRSRIASEQTKRPNRRKYDEEHFVSYY